MKFKYSIYCKALFLSFFFGVILLLSCNRSENKAIEIVKNTKMQILTDNPFANRFLEAAGYSQDSTWQDFANMQTKKDPNNKYSWSAAETDEDGTYIVAFVDSNDWGHRWEVRV